MRGKNYCALPRRAEPRSEERKQALLEVRIYKDVPSICFSLCMQAYEGVVQVVEAVHPMASSWRSPQNRDIAEGAQPACQQDQVHPALLLHNRPDAGMDILAYLQKAPGALLIRAQKTPDFLSDIAECASTKNASTISTELQRWRIPLFGSTSICCCFQSSRVELEHMLTRSNNQRAPLYIRGRVEVRKGSCIWLNSTRLKVPQEFDHFTIVSFQS